MQYLDFYFPQNFQFITWPKNLAEILDHSMVKPYHGQRCTNDEDADLIAPAAGPQVKGLARQGVDSQKLDNMIIYSHRLCLSLIWNNVTFTSDVVCSHSCS